MPVRLGHDKNGCYAAWGQVGHHYNYKCGDQAARKEAEHKAYLQGLATGEYEASKIGWDWDGTLSTAKGKEKATQQIADGATLYIITARNSKEGISFEGIPSDRIFAVGSNKAKIEKIKELGLDAFYDNNLDVVKQLPKVGRLFQNIKLAETYNDYPQAATENAKIALRWVEKNGWGTCGEATGKARANQLANREPISRDTIARMSSFERHRQNSQKELGDGCGRLMWLAWGGDEGIEWAKRKLKEIDNND
jgi:hypothetical protein